MVGLDPRLVRRLRAGEFAYQAHLDLHGMTSEEARGDVERFLTARLPGRQALRAHHPRARPQLEGSDPGPEEQAHDVAGARPVGPSHPRLHQSARRATVASVRCTCCCGGNAAKSAIRVTEGAKR